MLNILKISFWVSKIVENGKNRFDLNIPVKGGGFGNLKLLDNVF